jgi:hypothetical protein
MIESAKASEMSKSVAGWLDEVEFIVELASISRTVNWTFFFGGIVAADLFHSTDFENYLQKKSFEILELCFGTKTWKKTCHWNTSSWTFITALTRQVLRSLKFGLRSSSHLRCRGSNFSCFSSGNNSGRIWRAWKNELITSYSSDDLTCFRAHRRSTIWLHSIIRIS